MRAIINFGVPNDNYEKQEIKESIQSFLSKVEDIVDSNPSTNFKTLIYSEIINEE